MHGVRIAHRDGAELDGAPGRLEPIAVALLGDRERQRRGPEVGNAEIDADAIRRLDVRRDRAGGADELQLVAEPRRQVTREATDAVAALLHLAAIGVEDPIARVAAARVLAVDEQ